MSYKKALERIQKECGDVCEKYEICEHASCQSSYNAWAIADQALKSPQYIRLGLIIGILVLVVFSIIFGIIAIQEIHVNKKQIVELENRIEEIEKYKADYDRLKVEFITFKELTSNEFEQTWRTFGAVRANFLALGTGKFLCPDDFAPETEYKE